MTGAEIMSIAYGIEVLEEDDPFIKAAEHVASAGNEILRHGTYLVDLFPVCE